MQVHQEQLSPVSDIALRLAWEAMQNEKPRYLRLQRQARKLGLQLHTYRRCSMYDAAGGYTLNSRGSWVMFCEQQRLSLDEAECLLAAARQAHRGGRNDATARSDAGGRREGAQS